MKIIYFLSISLFLILINYMFVKYIESQGKDYNEEGI